MANNFSSATLGLGVDTKQFDKDLGAVGRDAEKILASMKLSADAFTDTWGNLTAGIKDTKRIVSGILVSQGFYALINALTEGGAAALQFSKNMETAAISLEYFVEGANKAAKAASFLRTMNEFAARTPFTTEQSIGLSKYMQAVGVAMGTTKSFLQVITDTAAATGATEENLQRIVFGLGQMMTKGRLANEEIRQLANANIPIYEILQEQLGLSGEQIAKIGKYWIDADKAVVAILTGLEQRYKGAADRISDTVTGMTDTIKDNAKIIGQIATSGVYESLADKMGIVRDALDRYREIATEKGSMGLFDQILRDLDATGEVGSQILALVGNARQLGTALLEVYRAAQPLIGLFGKSLYASLNVAAITLTGMSKVVTGVVEGLNKLGITSGTTAEVISSLFIAYQAAKWMAFLGQGLTAAAFSAVKMVQATTAILPATWQASAGVKMLTMSLAGLVTYGLAAAGIFSMINNSMAGLDTGKEAGDLFPTDYQAAMDEYEKKLAEYNARIEKYQKDYETPYSEIDDGSAKAIESLEEIEDASKKAAASVKNDWIASFDEVYSIPDKMDDKKLDELTPIDFGAFLQEPIFKFPTIEVDEAELKVPEFPWPEVYADSGWQDSDIFDGDWWKTLLPWVALGGAQALGDIFAKRKTLGPEATGKAVRSAVLEGAQIQRENLAKIVRNLGDIDSQIRSVLKSIDNPKVSGADREVLVSKLNQLIDEGEKQLKVGQEYGALLEKRADELVKLQTLSEAKRVSLENHIKTTLDKIDEYNKLLLDESFKTSAAGEVTAKEVKKLAADVRRTYEKMALGYGNDPLLETLIKDSNITLNSLDAKASTALELAQDSSKKYRSILDLLADNKLKTDVGAPYNLPFLKQLSGMLDDYNDELKNIAKLVAQTGVEVDSVGVEAYNRLKPIIDEFSKQTKKLAEMGGSFDALTELLANPVLPDEAKQALNAIRDSLKSELSDIDESFKNLRTTLLTTDNEKVELLRQAAAAKAAADEAKKQAQDAIREAQKRADEAARLAKIESDRLNRIATQGTQTRVRGATRTEAINAAKEQVKAQTDLKAVIDKLATQITNAEEALKTTTARLEEVNKTVDLANKQVQEARKLRDKAITGRVGATPEGIKEIDILKENVRIAGEAYTEAINVQKKLMAQVAKDNDYLAYVKRSFLSAQEELAKNTARLANTTEATYEAFEKVIRDADTTLQVRFATTLNDAKISPALEALAKRLGLTTDEIAASGTKLFRLMNGLGSFDGDIVTLLVDTLKGAGGLGKISTGLTSSFAELAMAIGSGLEDMVAAAGSDLISTMGTVYKGTFAANSEAFFRVQIDKLFKTLDNLVLPLDVKTMSGEAMEQLTKAGNEYLDNVYKLAASEFMKLKPEYGAQFGLEALGTGSKEVMMMAFNRNFDYATISDTFVKNFAAGLQRSVDSVARELSGRIFSVQAVSAYGAAHADLGTGAELFEAYKKNVVIPVFESTFGKGNIEALRKATKVFIINYTDEQLKSIAAGGYGKKWKALEELLATVIDNNNISEYLKTYVEIETAVGKRLAALDFAGAARRYTKIGSSPNKWLKAILGDTVDEFSRGALGPTLRKYIDGVIAAFNETGDGLKFSEDLKFITDELAKLRMGGVLSEKGAALFADSTGALVSDYDKLYKALTKIDTAHTLVSELPRKMRAVVDQVAAINRSIDLGLAVKGDQVYSVLKQMSYVIDKLGLTGSDAATTLMTQLSGMIDKIKLGTTGMATFDGMQLILPFKAVGIEETLQLTAVAIKDAVQSGALKVADGFEAAFKASISAIDTSSVVNKLVSNILSATDLFKVSSPNAMSIILDTETTGLITSGVGGKVQYPELAQIAMKNTKTGEMITAFINRGEAENRRIYELMTNLRDGTGELTDVAKQWQKSVTVEDLNKGITLDDLKKLISSYGPGIKTSGYNTTGFDIPIMNNLLGEGTFISEQDVMLTIQKKFGGLNDTLSNTYKRIIGVLEDGAHLASSDVEMTAKLIEAINDGTVDQIAAIAKRIAGSEAYTIKGKAKLQALYDDASRLYQEFGDAADDYIDSIVDGLSGVYPRLTPEMLFGTKTPIPRLPAGTNPTLPSDAQSKGLISELIDVFKKEEQQGKANWDEFYASANKAADDLKAAATETKDAAKSTNIAADNLADAAKATASSGMGRNAASVDDIIEYLTRLKIDPNATYRILLNQGTTITEQLVSGVKLQGLIDKAISKGSSIGFDIMDASGKQLFSEEALRGVSEFVANFRSFEKFTPLLEALEQMPATADYLTNAAKLYEEMGGGAAKLLADAINSAEQLGAADAYASAFTGLGDKLVANVSNALSTGGLSEKAAAKINKALADAFSTADLGLGTSVEDLNKQVLAQIKQIMGPAEFKKYSDAISTAVKGTIDDTFELAARSVAIPTASLSDDFAQAAGKAFSEAGEEVLTKAGSKIFSKLGSTLFGEIATGGLGLVDLIGPVITALQVSNEQKNKEQSLADRILAISKEPGADPNLVSALEKLTAKGLGPFDIAGDASIIESIFGGGDITTGGWGQVGTDIGITVGSGILTGLLFILGAAALPATLIGAGSAVGASLINGLVTSLQNDTFTDKQLEAFLTEKTAYTQAIASGLGEAEAQALQAAYTKAFTNIRFSEMKSDLSGFTLKGNEVGNLIFGQSDRNVDARTRLEGDSAAATANRLLRLEQAFGMKPMYDAEYTRYAGTIASTEEILKMIDDFRRDTGIYSRDPNVEQSYYQTGYMEEFKQALDWVFKEGNYDTDIGKAITDNFMQTKEERELIQQVYGKYIEAYDMREEFLDMVNKQTGKNYKLEDVNTKDLLEAIINFTHDVNEQRMTTFNTVAGGTSENTNPLLGNVSTVVPNIDFGAISQEALTTLAKETGITLSTVTSSYENSAGQMVDDIYGKLEIDSEAFMSRVIGWTQRLPNSMTLSLENITTDDLAVLAQAGIQINSDGTITFMKAANANTSGTDRDVDLKQTDVGGTVAEALSTAGLTFDFSGIEASLDISVDKIKDKMTSALFMLNKDLTGQISGSMKEQLTSLGTFTDSGYFQITDEAVLAGQTSIQQYLESLGYAFDKNGNYIYDKTDVLSGEVVNALMGINNIFKDEGPITAATIATWADGITLPSPIDEAQLTDELKASFAKIGITFAKEGDLFVMTVNRVGNKLKDGITLIPNETWDKVDKDIQDKLKELGVTITKNAETGFTEVDISGAFKEGMDQLVSAYIEQPEIWQYLPEKQRTMLEEMGLATSNGLLGVNAETIAGLVNMKTSWFGFMDETYNKLPQDIKDKLAAGGVETETGVLGIQKYVEGSTIPEGIGKYITVPFSEVPADVKASMGEAATELEGQQVIIYNATKFAFATMEQAVTEGTGSAVTEAQSAAAQIAKAVSDSMMLATTLSNIRISNDDWFTPDDKIRVSGYPGNYTIQYGGRKYTGINAPTEQDAIRLINQKYPEARIPLYGQVPGNPAYAFGGIINRHGLYEAGELGKQEAIIPLENKAGLRVIGNTIAQNMGAVRSPVQVSQLQSARMLANGGMTYQTAAEMLPYYAPNYSPNETPRSSSIDTNTDTRPSVYVQYLIADERGLRELERRLHVVRLEENARRSGS